MFNQSLGTQRSDVLPIRPGPKYRPLTTTVQNSCCSQLHFSKTLFAMLRKLAWVLAFILATFCWVVVIEHGPDNFIVGSKIEAENFKSLFFRLIQTPGK
jgi:hypothetical protein